MAFLNHFSHYDKNNEFELKYNYFFLTEISEID